MKDTNMKELSKKEKMRARRQQKREVLRRLGCRDDVSLKAFAELHKIPSYVLNRRIGKFLDGEYTFIKILSPSKPRSQETLKQWTARVHGFIIKDKADEIGVAEHTLKNRMARVKSGEWDISTALHEGNITPGAVGKDGKIKINKELVEVEGKREEYQHEELKGMQPRRRIEDLAKPTKYDLMFAGGW